MRLSVVRVFARWMVAFNPDTEVPPTGLLYAKQEQFRPRLCSTEEVAALMRAALAIASPLRAGTYSTLIGLLAATGMRVGEAIGLDRDAVDWDDGVVVVRWTKFNKTRELPLHASTLAALRAYAKLRQRHCPRPATAAFFVSTTGTRLIYNNVHTQFRRLVKQVGLLPQPGTGWPRPHDLRHSFAVASLVDWQRDHQDTEVFMPRLSAYLGHGEPSSTYWYLHTVPELVALAAERLEVSEEVGS
jgi:integrase